MDVRDFADSWEGTVLDEPAIRTGFAADARIAPLVLQDVTLRRIVGTITTTDGQFEAAELEQVDAANSDALASLTFDGSPLRSYLLFARLASEPDADPAFIILSLFASDRIEVRVVRDNDLYGVFRLERAE